LSGFGLTGFYTMKKGGEESGPRHLSVFKGIPVSWGSVFEGFNCINKGWR